MQKSGRVNSYREKLISILDGIAVFIKQLLRFIGMALLDSSESCTLLNDCYIDKDTPILPAEWDKRADMIHIENPFTPPTPIPTIPGTHYAGNVAPLAFLSPGSAHAVVDGNLQTEWVGGHMVELDLQWPFPVTIHRVVVWDRKQSAMDNNQINNLKLSFSDGTSTGSIDMISQGPRCADVTLPEKTITWLHIIPVDASGNNGYSEVEVWATTGPQYSNNTCVNKIAVPQTIP